MMKQFKMFMQDDEGASAVEYGLLVALIKGKVARGLKGR